MVAIVSNQMFSVSALPDAAFWRCAKNGLAGAIAMAFSAREVLAGEAPQDVPVTIRGWARPLGAEVASSRPAFGVRPTRRWRKPDSNHRSRVTPPSFRRRLMSLA